VPDLEPDPLDEHGAPRATAGGLSEDRCQQLAVQRASVYARRSTIYARRSTIGARSKASLSTLISVAETNKILGAHLDV